MYAYDEIDRTLHRKRDGHVLTPEIERGVPAEVRDIALGPGQEIVQPEDRIAFAEQSVAEMGADEASCAGNHNALHGLDRRLWIKGLWVRVSTYSNLASARAQPANRRKTGTQHQRPK